jgi:hypothetical protein
MEIAVPSAKSSAREMAKAVAAGAIRGSRGSMPEAFEPERRFDVGLEWDMQKPPISPQGTKNPATVNGEIGNNLRASG